MDSRHPQQHHPQQQGPPPPHNSQQQQQQQQHHYPTHASPPLHAPHHQPHSRAQSASSLPAMPPPNSPPNGAHGQHYGPPPSLPPPRAPTAFSSRELPALSSLTRNPPPGSSMSISSMLGGPPPVQRDSHGYPTPAHQQQQQQQQQQHSGPGGPPSSYAPSPRMHSAANEYPPFRRPHTPDHQRPDHQRPYEPRYSPGQAQQQQQQQQQQQPQPPQPPSHQGSYGTPDQRYPTPHYHSRNPSASTEPPRDRVSSGPPPPPARPSSQPKAYMPRPEDAYPRPPEYPDRRQPYPYDERYRDAERREREHREMEEHRARENRSRAYSGSEQRGPPPPHQPYGREPDPRDGQWGRQNSDPSYRAPMNPQQRHEYPNNGPSGYPPQPPYHHQQPGPRPHESPDRNRAPLPQYPQQHSQQGRAGPPPPGPGQPQMQQHPDAQRQPLPQRREEPSQGPYGQVPPGGQQQQQQYDRSRMEDPMVHQRNLLAVQDINRNKGRVSPLPQAVQGAQPQQHGPGGEPGIKNEFGRIFPGIGSGLSGLGMPSPTAASAQFASSSLKREEEADSGVDASGKGKGRRKKLRDEADEDGRSTPSKAKRTKQPLSSEQPIPRSRPESPPVQTQAPPPKPKPVPLPPKPKTIIRSAAVLDAASKHPRHHLGDFIYEPGLKASRLLPQIPTHRGFSSNPKPLPMDKIKGKINCTLTVKISHVHLAPASREEITARQYLWGTDIYTDDSDVVAACIHAGWIKGEWFQDVDADMLDIDAPESGKRRKRPQPVDSAASEGLITSTPAPMLVPEGRDLHVNVVILPRLLKYSSVTRHGMTSREFGGDVGARHLEHDGLSYMIQSLRWVQNGAGPQARLRGKARRERMKKAMSERRFVNTTPPNGLAEGDKITSKGEINGVWRSEGKASTAEGDKENAVEGVKEDIATEEKAVEPEAPTTADVEMKDEAASKEEATAVPAGDGEGEGEGEKAD